ncbi:MULTISPECIES: DUF1269 domain-containing protein [unclassified Neisseria]|uniref:DUF1269 domain-containing protein n=1 Tax=unclassified Neisseria TaxID=2623750 RepID=UPI001072AF0E|nr:MULTISPECIES: DUF1269 domain-containing protein [unclassified Neisseria]MBF0803974.1 DUF1269 domain-containing protein [Neisseria sp. 19428wB4_WF04]TFU43313.1 DUF1269 domain-containing protein [Neisseria sp. WF04]
MQQNIIVGLFNVPSEAYQAFSELKAYRQTHDSLIAQAVLVKKENGVITVADSTDFAENADEGAVTGGLLGALIGVLGGPVGMLLGGATGAIIGSSTGATVSLAEATLMESVSQKMINGDAAVIVLAQEASEVPADAFFGRFDTHVLRWSAESVQQEVLAAAEAETELQRQAREELRQRRKAERKEKAEELQNSLKQKFEDLGKKIKGG